MRQVILLSFALFWALPSLFTQGSFDGCNPDVLLAVDDHYIIQEEDLPSFTANLLSNDIIGMDAFVSIEDGLVLQMYEQRLEQVIPNTDGHRRVTITQHDDTHTA